jgi:hypothetical protein
MIRSDFGPLGPPALLTGASAAAAQTHGTADTRAAIAAGTWGTAEEVPGIEALNHGGFAEIVSVSCASAGNCSAGGSYSGARGSVRSTGDGG